MLSCSANLGLANNDDDYGAETTRSASLFEIRLGRRNGRAMAKLEQASRPRARERKWPAIIIWMIIVTGGKLAKLLWRAN